MNVSAKVDPKSLRALSEAMQIYERETKRDTAKVLNKAGATVSIFWSAQMPMANRNKIAADLRKIVVSTHTPKGRLRKKPRKIKQPLPLAYALLLARAKRKGEVLDRARLPALANRMINARIRSAGWHKAGLIPALRAFGAPLRYATGSKQIGKPKGSGTKATAARLQAKLSNTVKTVDVVGKAALETAVQQASAQLRKWAAQAVAERCAAFNAGHPGAGVPGLDY